MSRGVLRTTRCGTSSDSHHERCQSAYQSALYLQSYRENPLRKNLLKEEHVSEPLVRLSKRFRKSWMQLSQRENRSIFLHGKKYSSVRSSACLREAEFSRASKGQRSRRSLRQEEESDERCLQIQIRYRSASASRRWAIYPSFSLLNVVIMLFVGIILSSKPAVAHYDPERLQDYSYALAGSSQTPNTTSEKRIPNVPNSTTKDYGAEMGMDLINCNILSDKSIDLWEIVTSAFILKSFSLRDEEDLQQWNVTSKVVEQFHIPGVRRLKACSMCFLRRSQSRLLQVTQPLRILFDVSVSFQSASENHDVEQWILDIFGTAAQRAIYILALNGTIDESFESVQNVRVYSRNILRNEVQQNQQEGNNTTLIIVAIVLGSVSCVALAGLLGYLRFTSKKERDDSEQIEKALPPETNDVVTDDRVVAVVDMSNPVDPDLSTLGGSVASGYDAVASLDGTQHSEAPEGYNNRKSEYSRGGKEFGEYTASEGSTHQGSPSVGMYSFESGSLHANKQLSVISDDASFEMQFSGNGGENIFQVAAPRGKLGVIIDTPENSPPTVFAIKDTSPLAGAVTVGDQLVSVDGINTTEMSSVEVSQLLYEKAENHTRKLSFHRTIGSA